MDSAFPAVFVGIAALMALMVLGSGVRTVVGTLTVRKTLREGLRAEGRCVRVYARTHRSDDGPTRSTQHYVIEYATELGDQARFDTTDAPSVTIEGDFIPVAYLPGRPGKATVVIDGGRVPYGQMAGRLVFIALFVAVVTFIGLTGLDMGSGTGF